MTAASTKPSWRIGELAERAGVSIATIKYYIRAGLLPPSPVKTGRTMAYYDEAYLDRLRRIRVLREEHYLPIRVIRTLLAERGDGPMPEGDVALFDQVAPGVLRRLGSEMAPEPKSRAELLTASGLTPDELGFLEETGLIGTAGRYDRADAELLSALRALQTAGIDRDRFPIEELGHYVEILGELVRRELRTFTHRSHGVPPEELELLAVRAVTLSEPILLLVRRKLLLRALRAEIVQHHTAAAQSDHIDNLTNKEEEP